VGFDNLNISVFERYFSLWQVNAGFERHQNLVISYISPTNLWL
jgi:hypothetical protein